MTKKGALILMLLLFPSFLFAEVWDSNPIGQKVAKKEGLENVGWEKVEEGTVSTLYLDGKPVSVRTEYDWGYEQKEDGTLLRVILDEEGRLERKILEKDGKKEEYSYYYSSGIPVSSSLSVDSTVIKVTTYDFSSDGVLLGYGDGEDRTYITGERMVLSRLGELETIEKDGSLGEKEIQWLEGGGYTEKTIEEEREILSTYDSNGRLIKKETGEETYEYSYSSLGLLERETLYSSGSLTVTTYENGKKTVTEVFTSDGQIKERKEYLGDGTFLLTRYIDGKERYIFHLDKDGERILEARGL